MARGQLCMPPCAEQGPASPAAAGSRLCKHPQLCPALLPASLQLHAAGAKAPAAVRGCTTCSSRRGCGLDTPRDAQARPGCPAPGAQVVVGGCRDVSEHWEQLHAPGSSDVCPSICLYTFLPTIPGSSPHPRGFWPSSYTARSIGLAVKPLPFHPLSKISADH